MKYIFIIHFLAILFFSDCNNPKKTELSQENLKIEAKNYSLSIVKSYFDSDCDNVYSAISDSLLLIGRETILIKGQSKTVVKEIGTDISRHLNKENICLAVNKAITDMKVKDNLDSSKEFIWDDMFLFMVRKEKKIWKIKALSD